jgi:hypothetical protein
MNKITYGIIFLLFLSACQSKKDPGKDNEATITGTWEYERIELYNGEKFDITDSMQNVLHKQHLGLMLIFSEGKTFTVKQKKNGLGVPEFVARQDYELPGDTMLRLINTGRPHDEFEVISLSDSLFKVNLFDSPWGYVVFRRVEGQK